MRPVVVSASISIYARVVRCYPSNLRMEFGEVLVDTFAETIETSWSRERWRGACRAWRGVANDIAVIVVPHWLEYGTPVVLAIICAIVIFGSMLGVIDPNRTCHP